MLTVRAAVRSISNAAPLRMRMVHGWSAVFVLVSLTHGALLVWATETLNREPVLAAAPTLVGQLVSQAPVSEPAPLPVQPVPPKPRPVVKPRPAPLPPSPKAPTPERAVTAPPHDPLAPIEAKPPVVDSVAPAAASVAAAPAPVAREPAEPVIPPRSDAEHLSNPAPLYPPASRRLREQGRVLFDVYILPDGSVGEIKLKRSSGFARLDQAALETVRQWRYVPAKRGDHPIPYWHVQPVDFAMR